jgi:hypothetical protein
VQRLARVGGAQVLEEKGHALERAVGEVRRLGLGASVLEQLVDDRVELGVDLLDPCDRRLNEFRGCGVSVSHQLRLSRCIHAHEFDHPTRLFEAARS